MPGLTEQDSYLWEKLKVSSWLIPLGMSFGALGLAVLMLEVDALFGHVDWGVAKVIRIDAAGVRQVVAVTTGAMMTITGVVFSVSVVTLTLASNQFGPRVLRNYLRDTGNKVVLGLFVASFIYGLLILASVDTREDGFIPVLSMVVSLALTVLAIGGLIYFIHNISTTIQADNIIALIGEELNESIHALLIPCGSANGGKPGPCRQEWSLQQNGLASCAVKSPRSGYIQSIDYAGLAALAAEAGCLLDINKRAGQFVVEHTSIATCYGVDEVPDEFVARLFGFIVFGRQRTPVQDIEFSVEQLVQIALRALSPGINDSLTAITCIDWLSAALGRMSCCEFPSYCFRDTGGVLRVVTDGFSFEGVVNAMFDPVRQNAGGNEMVAIRALEALYQVIEVAQKPAYRTALLRQAELIHQASRESIAIAADREALTERFESCKQVFADRNAESAPQTA